MSSVLPADLKDIGLKSFVDMPAAVPARQIPLQRVGISNRPHYIRIADPFDGSPRELLANIDVSFALPANRRGIHMSRIEESLLQLRNEEVLPLHQYTEKLYSRLSDLQELPAATLDVRCDYEKVVAKNPSGKMGSELLKLYSSLTKDGTGAGVQPEIGIAVPFMNACPCTQRWGMRDFYNTLKAEDYSDAEMRFLLDTAPKQAHTNRGTATIKILSEGVAIAELYDVLDRSVPIVRELLKGMDEHEFVKRTHGEGSFCEDNMRSVLAEIVSTFKDKLSPKTRVSVNIEVDESVHHHNLTAVVVDSLENINASIA